MASNATIMFYKLAFSCDRAESDILALPPSMMYIDLRVCVCEYELSWSYFLEYIPVLAPHTWFAKFPESG